MKATEENVMPTEWFDISNEDHFWFQWRSRIFFHWVRKFQLQQTLQNGVDIGCGTGIVRRDIESKTDWRIDGIDSNELALERNPKLRGEAFAYNILKPDPKLKEKYDFIILFDVLEHIEDDKGFLEAALFHLKKGGIVFINVPSIPSVHSKFDDAVGHIMRYNPKMLRQLCQSTNLEVMQLAYWGFVLVPILWIRKVVNVFSSRTKDEIIKKGFQPSNIVNSILKIAMKVESAILGKPPIGSSLIVVAKK